MADTKISALSSTSPGQDADAIPIVRTGLNFQLAASDLLVRTGNITFVADSDANASGDLIFKTGATEVLRIKNGGQLYRDDYNIPFGDSTAFVQMRRHTVNPVGQKYLGFFDVQSHGTKTVGDGTTGLLVNMEDDSSVATSPKSITNCVNNGSGLIRVTCTGHGFATNDWIGVYGVTGTTEANNAWQVTVIDANTFDLQASTFTNAYVSGGKATNRPKMFGIAVDVIPQQTRGVVGGIALTNNSANADDLNGVVVYNGSTTNARATSAFIAGKNNSFTGDQWGSAYQIEANLTTGMQFQGMNCSSYGVDFQGTGASSATYGVAAIRLPNNVLVNAMNAAGSGDVQLFKCDTLNELQVLAPARLSGSTTFDGGVTVNNTVTFLDAKNIATGTTTGTIIGTATNQKIGFYNVTPVIQQNTTGNTHTVTAGSTTSVFTNTTFDGSTGSTSYTVGDIVKALKAYGLLAV